MRRRRTANQELTTESDPPKIENEGAVDDPFPIEAEIEELPESRTTPAPDCPPVAPTLPATKPKRDKGPTAQGTAAQELFSFEEP